VKWASALSHRVDARQALAEACDGVLEALGGPPDLALLFVSDHYAGALDALPGWTQSLLSPGHLIGCSASGVIGAGREVERSESISVVAARLPAVTLSPFHLSAAPRALESEFFSELTGLSADQVRGFVLIGDPASMETEDVLKRFDAAYPNAPKIGGLVSGVESEGQAALFLGERRIDQGLVGLAVGGPIELQTVVAQGCRPIGDPMIITRCKDSVIYELNVGKPVDALQKLYERLEPRDQELCRHSLFVGIEMSGRSHSYGHGDFVIRALAGLEPNGGAMAVHGHFSNYQVVQFHLRDARAAAQDLEHRLVRLQRAGAVPDGSGALLFSCIGRGQGLYGVPNHDSDLFCKHVGALPLGGFFANGEIGPVGGQTFLHGYTSAFGIFRPRPAD
jgi:small ligand-binding sensory domain FIST